MAAGSDHLAEPHSKLDIVEAGHFTWEDAAADYAALITSWWAGGHEATSRTPVKSLKSQSGGKGRMS
jgi:hypothetical protein